MPKRIFIILLFSLSCTESSFELPYITRNLDLTKKTFQCYTELSSSAFTPVPSYNSEKIKNISISKTDKITFSFYADLQKNNILVTYQGSENKISLIGYDTGENARLVFYEDLQRSNKNTNNGLFQIYIITAKGDFIFFQNKISAFSNYVSGIYTGYCE
ncbi:hypothetical protein EHQ68_01315 [Leptospira congkakensis]|uniref:Lipoprotein n=1 Tax=Leptospira congkakensis TaxID=2484932 RepID=A0A8B5NM42_9LEPT|nr:hypothetical protein [Leptospira congkakensis]TGL91107.1 hypothetical protein EHQ68_01315 [Leptospira congkakensis]TGL97048.1 hypothetical protein EHQ69_00125 [Leptospira congkakensis]